MGFRFNKRIKILPGLTINLSKSGVSTSIGTTGARVTLGHGKIRKTVGIPGTGISHTTVKNINSSQQQQQQRQEEPQADGMSMGRLLIWGIGGLFIFLIINGFFNG